MKNKASIFDKSALTDWARAQSSERSQRESFFVPFDDDLTFSLCLCQHSVTVCSVNGCMTFRAWNQYWLTSPLHAHEHDVKCHPAWQNLIQVIAAHVRQLHRIREWNSISGASDWRRLQLDWYHVFLARTLCPPVRLWKKHDSKVYSFSKTG